MLYNISKDACGVDLVVGVKDMHASLFSFLSLSMCFFFRKLGYHMLLAYDNFGLTTPVKTHRINLGFGP